LTKSAKFTKKQPYNWDKNRDKVLATGKITKAAIARAKRPCKLHDGGGLYLRLSATGGTWSLRIQRDGRVEERSLGRLSDLTIAEARRMATERRKQMIRLPARTTFGTASERYWSLRVDPSMSAPKASQQWITSIRNHCGDIHDLPIAGVRPQQVKVVLERVMDRPSLFSRLHQRISAVMQWAIATQQRHDPDPVPSALLLLPVIQHKEQSHSAIRWQDAPALFARAMEIDTPASRCLVAVMLTGLRSATARGLMISEWTDPFAFTIPPERNKTRDEFVMPVTSFLSGYLSKAPRSGDLIFPAKSGRQLSENALAVALRRIDAGHVTAHGMRSTIRTFHLDHDVPRHVAEACLGHRVAENRVEGAYIRSSLLKQRMEAMQLWEDHLTSTGDAKPMMWFDR